MARLGTKGPHIATSDVYRWLDHVSKTALIDLVAQNVALIEGHCDEPATIDEIRAHAEPILRLRGDRIPKTR